MGEGAGDRALVVPTLPLCCLSEARRRSTSELSVFGFRVWGFGFRPGARGLKVLGLRVCRS